VARRVVQRMNHVFLVFFEQSGICQRRVHILRSREAKGLMAFSEVEIQFQPSIPSRVL
jgi:hypothetical protein